MWDVMHSHKHARAHARAHYTLPLIVWLFQHCQIVYSCNICKYKLVPPECGRVGPLKPRGTICERLLRLKSQFERRKLKEKRQRLARRQQQAADCLHSRQQKQFWVVRRCTQVRRRRGQAIEFVRRCQLLARYR